MNNLCVFVFLSVRFSGEFWCCICSIAVVSLYPVGAVGVHHRLAEKLAFAIAPDSVVISFVFRVFCLDWLHNLESTDIIP